MSIITTGTLTSKVTSTASSPNVNYRLTYSATRSASADKSVSVVLTITAALPSSGSKLGTGIKLTGYARVNGGSWQSVVIKTTSAAWSGTGAHTATITFSVSTTSSSVKVDFYVSRTGSTFSGTAGTLGSSGSPKSYTAKLPAYSAGGGVQPETPSPTATSQCAFVKNAAAGERATPYIRVIGAWEKAAVKIRDGGVWKGLKKS